MNCWLVLSESWDFREEYGAKARESALWDAVHGEWSYTTGAAYRTREEAESAAMYAQALLPHGGRTITTMVLHFDEVLDYYGIGKEPGS